MQENKDLRSRYLEHKQQLDELKNHVKFLTKVNSISVQNRSKKPHSVSSG